MKNQIERLASQFRPYELAKVLPFKDAMRLANKLLIHNHMNDPWRNYAIEFLYSIKMKFPEEWNSSWQNDAFLGNACSFACRFNEKYYAYKQAIDKTKSPPPELLVAYAGCNSSPGEPLVSEEEALQILIGIANEKPYKEVVRMIARGGYSDIKNSPEKLNYWENLYKKIEESKNTETLPEMKPDFLKEEIEMDLSQINNYPTKNRNDQLLEIGKKILDNEKIPREVKAITLEWVGGEIVLSTYYEGEINSKIKELSFIAYTRIAANYLKDYSYENNKIINFQDIKSINVDNLIYNNF